MPRRPPPSCMRTAERYRRAADADQRVPRRRVCGRSGSPVRRDARVRRLGRTAGRAAIRRRRRPMAMAGSLTWRACRCIRPRARPACPKSRCDRASRQRRKPGITSKRLASPPPIRSLAVSPMCHAYAYGMCVMVPLAERRPRGLDAQLSSQPGVSTRWPTSRVTILPAVPAMLDVLMFGAGDRLRGAVRTVLSAGSPLSERTASRFFARSRTSRCGRCMAPRKPAESPWRPPATSSLPGGCVGPPMHGVEAQVRPDSTTDEAPPGVGQLYIRSSSMMTGYLGRAMRSTRRRSMTVGSPRAIWPGSTRPVAST